MFNRFLALASAALLPALASLAITPLWLRDVSISPDGSQIVFQYKGDLWKVPAAGGSAVRLTSADSYESSPVWSPDGRTIAFASNRHGNNDVFVMPSAGGAPVRLTSNSAAEIPEAFSPDGRSVFFSASIQDPASSALFPSTRMLELYSVPVAGGKTSQVLATPARRISFGGPDWFLYQDIKGFEDEWRKHHTSSVTRDIWRYDMKTGAHTRLLDRPGEDLDPVVAGDMVYFLSERDGAPINVYSAPLSDLSAAKPVTSFKGHPVRFLSRAADGTLCFAWDGEIYTLAPGRKPVKVAIDIVDDSEPAVRRLALRNASSVAPSPDGKDVAFISRGDVFVTSVEYNTTKQITSTPEAERGLDWGKDGRTLYYGSERDGRVNIYKATMQRDDDPNFPNSTVIVEERLFKNDGVERSYPDVSPDGKLLAFIKDRNRLCVMDIKSGSVREILDGSQWPSRSGGFGFEWSPDSKWIVTDIIDRKHEPYSDVALVNVQTGQVTNLTNTGYFAEGARFTPDGNAIIYRTDRYGMRAHASWGSQTDVMMVFLNQDAYDRFRLSEEDYALLKEVEKKAKKDSDKKDADKKDADKKDSDKDKDIVVELDGICDRTVRLTPMSTSMSDAIITPDGESLYYVMTANNGRQLWKLGLRKDDHKMVGSATGISGFATSGDGKTLFAVGQSIRKLDPKTDKLTPVNFSASINLDPAAERLYMFDYVTREEGERFYSKGMHGVDWPALTKHYRRFMPHIANNYDFAELLSEMLGELNVSHTGGRFSPEPNTSADVTASLGLLYDMAYDGPGLRVDEVVKGGPFDRASSKVRPGTLVTAVNGVSLKAGDDISLLLNNVAGKKTLVSFSDGGDTWDEVVIPVTNSRMSSLLYDRWVRRRADDVDRWSGGRLGYVHIKSMGDDSFRKVYSDVLGKYNDRDGIVIDIRWNSGGRLHEDIEVFFSGEKYLTQEVRGVDACDMPSRRWNKPSIMLMSEACYSNAHGTPWVYKHRNIGKLVGAPVPGTMTSVNWVTMQDPTMVFGIPVTGYRTAEGTYLENSQLEPDILIYNDPAVIVTGEDQQLRKAVETLLRDLPAK